MAQYFFMSETTFLVFINALNGVQSCQSKLRATLTSPCVGRAPGDCGVRARSRHHRVLLLRKHRRRRKLSGNMPNIFRNPPEYSMEAPQSHSGKNNWQNVISRNTVKSSKSRGKCYVTVWSIPRWHNNTRNYVREAKCATQREVTNLSPSFLKFVHKDDTSQQVVSYYLKTITAAPI